MIEHTTTFNGHTIRRFEDMYRLNDVIVATGMHPKYASQIAARIDEYEKDKVQVDVARRQDRGHAWYVTLEGLGQWLGGLRHSAKKATRHALQQFIEEQIVSEVG